MQVAHVTKVRDVDVRVRIDGSPATESVYTEAWLYPITTPTNIKVEKLIWKTEQKLFPAWIKLSWIYVAAD